MSAPDIETLLSARDIAKQCGDEMNPRTILRWAKAGRIPCVRINARVVKFDPSDVRKALKKLSS